MTFKEKCSSCRKESAKPAMMGAKFAMASEKLKLNTTTIQVGPSSKPIVATAHRGSKSGKREEASGWAREGTFTTPSFSSSNQ